MNTDTYCAMYNYLVLDRRIDPDDAKCILSDIDEEATDSDHAWDLLEDLV